MVFTGFNNEVQVFAYYAGEARLLEVCLCVSWEIRIVFRIFACVVGCTHETPGYVYGEWLKTVVLCQMLRSCSFCTRQV